MLNGLHLLLALLRRVNDALLAVCRAIGVVAIAAMVIAILVQVWFRYILGNALPWPDEFARFCMLWMTGLLAPVAYRSGGFVAIDMLADFLGTRIAALLNLSLFILSALVLYTGIKLGYKHVNSGWLFASSSLRLPLELIGMQNVKLKLVYMYSSLWIGLILLLLVNLELVLRALLILFGRNDDERRPQQYQEAS